MARTGFLLFPFSAADQARVDTASITVTDIAFSATATAGTPHPQAMRLGFRLTGASPIPQVRPLVPGLVRFIADPNAPGIAPDPDDVEFTSAAFATWRTRGTIRVTVHADAAKDLARLVQDLPVLPNVFWYGPVRITQDFLFVTLRSGLQRRRIAGATAIQPTNPAWDKHAVAHFLAGRYEPFVDAGASAAGDDRIAHAMPTVQPDGAQHAVTLTITAAARRAPADGTRKALHDLSTRIDRDDPAHAANGAVPARHVLRTVRSHLTDGTAGAAVPDAVLRSTGSAPTYRAVRFTRTWQPVAECSVHFPGLVVVIAGQTGAELARQRMPAHGVLFWSSPANAPITDITVSLLGDVRWIDGATPHVWRHPGADTPVAFDLTAVADPHVQVRRRMRDAMLAESRDRPGGPRCTYMSLRRSVRALVDNRICGGRLNHGRSRTGADTRQLMDDAWAGTPARAGMVTNNRPLPALAPSAGAPRLIPILRAFFPAQVPAQTIGGSTQRTTVFDGGEMAYRLWQTIISTFHANGTKRNFPPTAVGRGGPGALVATGLAGAYAVDPVRAPNEDDQDYFDRIVGDMSAGLEPGAALQFWNDADDFEGIKGTQTAATAHAMSSYGHSPVFLAYIRQGGAVTGIRIIDQFGESDCDIRGGAGSRQIEWHGDEQEIWIAANWVE